MEVTLILSLIAIGISATTAWFTFFHKGKVKMTHPNIFAIIPREGLSVACPKIYMRVLLYCTSKSGRAVESMYLKISREGDVRKFQYWAHGESRELVPGSGIFVGPQGYEANHHFTPLEDNATYDFQTGKYSIEVYGKVVGASAPVPMAVLSFNLGIPEANALKESQDTAVFFWWDAEGRNYIPRIDRKRNHTPRV